MRYDACCEFEAMMMLMCCQDPLAFGCRRCSITCPEENQPDRSPSHDKVERCGDIPEILYTARMYGHESSLYTNGNGVSCLDGGLKYRSYHTCLFGGGGCHCANTSLSAMSDDEERSSHSTGGSDVVGHRAKRHAWEEVFPVPHARPGFVGDKETITN